MPTNLRSPISALRPFVDSGALAGAVTLVASKEKILSLESIGYSDIAAKKPMRIDPMFWIASMTKPGTRYLYSNSGTNVGGRIVELSPAFPSKNSSMSDCSFHWA
jgi:CubicO group peptidase (beta-lactamase class C family)